MCVTETAQTPEADKEDEVVYMREIRLASPLGYDGLDYDRWPDD